MYAMNIITYPRPVLEPAADFCMSKVAADLIQVSN